MAGAPRLLHVLVASNEECGSIGHGPLIRPPRPREVFSRLHLRPPSPLGTPIGRGMGGFEKALWVRGQQLSLANLTEV